MLSRFFINLILFSESGNKSLFHWLNPLFIIVLGIYVIYPMGVILPILVLYAVKSQYLSVGI